MKELALEKRKRKGEGKGDTEWQTATKGPRGNSVTRQEKQKKGRREREKSREDWMRMARWPLISSRERETVPGSTKNEEGSLTRGGIGRGAREKKREEMVEKDRGGNLAECRVTRLNN